MSTNSSPARMSALSLAFSDGLCVRLDRAVALFMSESVIFSPTNDTVFRLDISLEKINDT